MSVIFHGMDFPTSCISCKFRDVECGGECILMPNNGFATYGEQFDACPFNKVAHVFQTIVIANHGRLVDADKLDGAMANESEGYGGSVYSCGISDGIALSRECLEHAETVVPAEKIS